MGFTCLDCKKEFKYESKLIEHKKRKIPCNKVKEDLKCDICNINFVRPSHKKIHEKTKKHIKYCKKNNNRVDNVNDNKYDNFDFNLILIENKNLNNKNNELNEIITQNILQIEQLTHQNKKLLDDNQYLKNNNKIHNNNEFIYIIHCAQHINTNIYKIGYTKNIIKRFKNYPKGSEILFMMNCKNAKLIESKILTYLKENNHYYQYKEAGNEYFQCNLENLKNDIQKILSEN